MTSFKFYSLFFVMFFPAMALHANEKPVISVQASVDKAFVTIGEPVVYTITIKHDPDILILNAPQAPNENVLKVKKIEEFRDQDDNQVVEGRKITLTSFRLGEFILDPVEIKYRGKDGTIQSITTNEIYLTVRSVAEGQPKTDIRGIKPVLPVKSDHRWLYFFLGGLGALIFFFLAFLYVRKSRLSAETHVEIQNPEQEAHRALNALFDSDFIRRGKFKDYYSKLSEILRIYLERRYHILAIESTTFEILHYLKQKETPEKLVQKIDEVLLAADMAKFAKWVPEPTEIIQLNKKSKEIIDDSAQKEIPHGV